MTEIQLINDGISADMPDDFWNDRMTVFRLTNTIVLYFFFCGFSSWFLLFSLWYFSNACLGDK